MGNHITDYPSADTDLLHKLASSSFVADVSFPLPSLLGKA